MKTNRGFIAIPILVAILLGIAALGGGAYFVVREKSSTQTTSQVPLSENNSKEYNNQKLGLTLRYPSSWTNSSQPQTSSVNADFIQLVSSSKEQISIIAQINSITEADILKDAIQKNGGGSVMMSSGFEGITGVDDLGDKHFSLYKRINAESYLFITASVSASVQNIADYKGQFSAKKPIKDTENAEKVFLSILSTVSINPNVNPSSGSPNNSDKPIITLEASTLQIKTGQPSVISWHVTGASKCAFITPKNEEIPFDGEKSVSPTKTTLYTVWCARGTGNNHAISAQKEITISVQPDITTKPNSADLNATGIRRTNLDSEQSTFAAMSVGTPLQGHILEPADAYTFTDGKEGVDTVAYKKSKSNYTIYRGNDLPEKGYYNVMIVTGNDHHFIEVDVNSEIYEFLDQRLSIPDLKVVSAGPTPPRITFGASKDGVTFLQNLVITAGTPITLKWIVNSASNCVLNRGTEGEQFSVEETVVESPAVSTTYRLWCVNRLEDKRESSTQEIVTVLVQ